MWQIACSLLTRNMVAFPEALTTLSMHINVDKTGVFIYAWICPKENADLDTFSVVHGLNLKRQLVFACLPFMLLQINL